MVIEQNATEELQRLEHAFDSVKKQLFGRLHMILRKDLFQGPASPPEPALNGKYALGQLSETSQALGAEPGREHVDPDVLSPIQSNGAS